MDEPDDSDSVAIQRELERQLGFRSTEDLTPEQRLWRMERAAFVCAGAPDQAQRRTGPVSRLVRRVIFKLTRWYVEPFVLQQRAFNLELVRYIADLERRERSVDGDSEADRA